MICKAKSTINRRSAKIIILVSTRATLWIYCLRQTHPSICWIHEEAIFNPFFPLITRGYIPITVCPKGKIF